MLTILPYVLVLTSGRWPHTFLLMKEILLKRFGVFLQRLKLDARITYPN